MAIIARTAQISASQEFQDVIDTDVSDHGRPDSAEQRLAVLVFAERRPEKHMFIFVCKKVGIGLDGGNGTSKVGVGSRSGGSGEEYDEQVGGQVRRIEEGDRKGGKGADSSEDVG